jgi:hypothetical protein
MRKPTQEPAKRAAGSRGQGVCFVICAIDDPGTPIRKRADQVLNRVIRPAVRPLGYKAVRSDKEGTPGEITPQIIAHLIEDPIVVADLTWANPNVYYELAIRHCFRKPVITMMEEGHPFQFDVRGLRTILVNTSNWEVPKRCVAELRAQVGEATSSPEGIITPVSIATDLTAALGSQEPIAALLAAILQKLDSLPSLRRAEAYPTGSPLPTSLSVGKIGLAHDGATNALATIQSVQSLGGAQSVLTPGLAQRLAAAQSVLTPELTQRLATAQSVLTPEMTKRLIAAQSLLTPEVARRLAAAQTGILDVTGVKGARRATGPTAIED